jgi:dihydroorotate dehydrogenase
MVYKGPGVVSRIRKELAELMLQNGQRSIDDVVGMDHDDIFWRKREEHAERARKKIASMAVIDP